MTTKTREFAIQQTSVSVYYLAVLSIILALPSSPVQVYSVTGKLIWFELKMHFSIFDLFLPTSNLWLCLLLLGAGFFRGPPGVFAAAPSTAKG